jgi:hypothetical protein
MISCDDLDETSAIEVARKPCYTAEPAAMSVAGPIVPTCAADKVIGYLGSVRRTGEEDGHVI